MAFRYVLTGYMGSGKSSVGRKMSYRIRAPFMDTDSIIERRAGKTINEIFADEGENAFRDMETECLREILQKEKGRFILSTGGGMPVREENRELMHRIGTVVYLKCSPETVYERLKGDTKRPLLAKDASLEKITAMLREREGIYESNADIVVECDGKGLEEILDEITGERKGYVRNSDRPAEQKPADQRFADQRFADQKPGDQKPAEQRFSEQGAAEKKPGDQKPADQESADLKPADVVDDAPKRAKILVINGPNINFLGIREKGVYGDQNYDYLLSMIAEKGRETGVTIEVFQSNHEGAIIDRLQDSYFDGTEGIVINPGAYSHYSYAIRDALASLEKIPKIEIHISDIRTREDFRKNSVTREVCDGSIIGQGLPGYLDAIDEILKIIDRKKSVL